MMNEKEIERLWQHRINAETNFNNRLNFFLVFESILMAVVAQLFQFRQQLTWRLVAITIIGLVITVVWWLVQEKERLILEAIKFASKKRIPDYKRRTRLIDYKTKGLNFFSINRLLTYGVPLLVALMWVVLLIAAISVSNVEIKVPEKPAGETPPANNAFNPTPR